MTHPDAAGAPQIRPQFLFKKHPAVRARHHLSIVHLCVADRWASWLAVSKGARMADAVLTHSRADHPAPSPKSDLRDSSGRKASAAGGEGDRKAPIARDGSDGKLPAPDEGDRKETTARSESDRKAPAAGGEGERKSPTARDGGDGKLPAPGGEGDRKEKAARSEGDRKAPAGEGKSDHKAPAAGAAKAQLAEYAQRRSVTAAPAMFAVVLAASLLTGWLNRGEEYVIPESGVGYWLGVAGASAMLLLLLYPLRKRMRFRGSVTLWFRLHMVLGLIGPALILFHSNFRLGSLNSNVALVAMLTVATSGIIGRYLYAKIHMGLYGRKAVLQDLSADAEALEKSLGSGISGCDQIVAQMRAFADGAASLPKGVLASFWTLPFVALRARFLRRRLQRQAYRLVKSEAKRLKWSRRVRRQQFRGIINVVTLHVAAVKKAAAFELYDRLFGLWHVLHLPLFMILILAACIHVVAAHLY